MTRVAYVCADPGVPVFGTKGASVHVCEVVRALLAHGAQVELIAARRGGSPPPDLAGVAVHLLPVHRGAQRERAARAVGAAVPAAIEALGPVDLVYERYSLWSGDAMAWAAAAGVPGLLEVNAPLIDEQSRHRGLADRAGAEAVARSAMGAAAAVLAVSRPVAEWASRYVDDPARVHVVPNGVDPRRFRPPPGWSPMAGATATVGFVGTLKPWHGLATLAGAFARLAAADAGWRLLVVGDGPEAGPLAARLAAAGVDGRAELVGAVKPAAVPGLLARMDVAVAPYPASAGYFSPLKLYEYLAAGLPVVASRVGQVPEVVADGTNGLLCPPDDAGALAGALARLRHDPALAARLGAAGRERVARDHTWLAVAGTVLSLAGAPARAGA